MSTLRYVNMQWLDLNSARRYPLAYDATAKDLTGAFELPDDFIVGLYLPIHVSLNVQAHHFTLRRVGVYGTGYTAAIGYDNGTTITEVAAVSIDRATHTFGKPYVLRGLGEFYDSIGQIVIGNLDAINQQPPGLWTFDLIGGRIEPDAIRPQIRGLSSMRVQNGDSLSDPAVGDIILRAGRNSRITPILVGGQDPVFVFDAIEGEGLNEECVCSADLTAATPIRTINKIPPTPDGNFTLLESDCVSLEPIENGLQIANSCSKPCCGCRELEIVTTAMENFGQQATTLNNFIVNLEARVTQMDQSVLASKLSDRGCGCS
jgi:hypothetical protein